MSKVGRYGYVLNLRPRGAKISSGGETNGPVSMMELFVPPPMSSRKAR